MQNRRARPCSQVAKGPCKSRPTPKASSNHRARVHPHRLSQTSTSSSKLHSFPTPSSVITTSLRSNHTSAPPSQQQPRKPPTRNVHGLFDMQKPAPGSVKPVRVPEGTPSFASIGVPTDIADVLTKQGIIAPSSIQSLAIPSILDNSHDISVAAQTGQGKTLSYAIPLVMKLTRDAKEFGRVSLPNQPRAIVLVPNRELALQVQSTFKTLSHASEHRVKTVALTGHYSIAKMRQLLRGESSNRSLMVLAQTERIVRDQIRLTASFAARLIIALFKKQNLKLREEMKKRNRKEEQYYQTQIIKLCKEYNLDAQGNFLDDYDNDEISSTAGATTTPTAVLDPQMRENVSKTIKELLEKRNNAYISTIPDVIPRVRNWSQIKRCIKRETTRFAYALFTIAQGDETINNEMFKQVDSILKRRSKKNSNNKNADKNKNKNSIESIITSNNVDESNISPIHVDLDNIHPLLRDKFTDFCNVEPLLARNMAQRAIQPMAHHHLQQEDQTSQFLALPFPMMSQQIHQEFPNENDYQNQVHFMQYPLAMPRDMWKHLDKHLTSSYREPLDIVHEKDHNQKNAPFSSTPIYDLSPYQQQQLLRQSLPPFVHSPDHIISTWSSASPVSTPDFRSWQESRSQLYLNQQHTQRRHEESAVHDDILSLGQIPISRRGDLYMQNNAISSEHHQSHGKTPSPVPANSSTSSPLSFDNQIHHLNGHSQKQRKSVRNQAEYEDDDDDDDGDGNDDDDEVTDDDIEDISEQDLQENNAILNQLPNIPRNTSHHTWNSAIASLYPHRSPDRRVYTDFNLDLDYITRVALHSLAALESQIVQLHDSTATFDGFPLSPSLLHQSSQTPSATTTTGAGESHQPSLITYDSLRGMLRQQLHRIPLSELAEVTRTVLNDMVENNFLRTEVTLHDKSAFQRGEYGTLEREDEHIHQHNDDLSEDLSGDVSDDIEDDDIIPGGSTSPSEDSNEHHHIAKKHHNDTTEQLIAQQSLPTRAFLQRNVDILVCTPARMLQLLRDESLQLHNTNYIVFDEADLLFTARTHAPENPQTLRRHTEQDISSNLLAKLHYEKKNHKNSSILSGDAPLRTQSAPEMRRTAALMDLQVRNGELYRALVPLMSRMLHSYAYDTGYWPVVRQANDVFRLTASAPHERPVANKVSELTKEQESELIRQVKEHHPHVVPKSPEFEHLIEQYRQERLVDDFGHQLADPPKNTRYALNNTTPTRASRLLPPLQMIYTSATLSERTQFLHELNKYVPLYDELYAPRPLVQVQSSDHLCLPTSLKQTFVQVGQRDKLEMLHELLANEYVRVPSNNDQLQQQQQSGQSTDLPYYNMLTMVFCNTISSARAVFHSLREHGVSVVASHSGIPPQVRAQYWDQFMNNNAAVMVATDIASRGIHHPSLRYIINFDFPYNAMDYLHRAGRAAALPGVTGVSQLRSNAVVNVDVIQTTEHTSRQAFSSTDLAHPASMTTPDSQNTTSGSSPTTTSPQRDETSGQTIQQNVPAQTRVTLDVSGKPVQRRGHIISLVCKADQTLAQAIHEASKNVQPIANLSSNKEAYNPNAILDRENVHDHARSTSMREEPKMSGRLGGSEHGHLSSSSRSTSSPTSRREQNNERERLMRQIHKFDIVKSNSGVAVQMDSRARARILRSAVSERMNKSKWSNTSEKTRRVDLTSDSRRAEQRFVKQQAAYAESLGIDRAMLSRTAQLKQTFPQSAIEDKVQKALQDQREKQWKRSKGNKNNNKSKK